MFKYFSGIDEAALGPILGPYCCALTTFKIQNEVELFDLFAQLKEIKICDSKKLYTSGKTIEALENTALTFSSYYLKKQPETLLDLLSSLLICKKDINGILNIPWFNRLASLKLPVVCHSDQIRKNTILLTDFMSNKNIELTNITIDLVPAVKFNQFLNSGLNKSQCCQKIISPLMHKSLLENSRITVDRQGGRRYYGEWLVDLFNSVPISINRETKDLSSYNINHSEIRFQVKGDDKYLETALASIFSKYIRELMMICFNEYWHEQTSGIKKTAGYPQDGKRFINDLKEKHIAYDREKLIRKK